VDGIMQKVAWGPNDQSTWHTDYNMRGDAYLNDYKKRLEKAGAGAPRRAAPPARRGGEGAVVDPALLCNY
jgi:hypothetical protein